MKHVVVTILAVLCLSTLIMGQENVVVPYILKAPAPITVDGVLDEWDFAFPLDHNQWTVPADGRFRSENPGWFIDDPYDCSGTLYMMYDQDHFYFAASVRDDAPGHYSDAAWAADAIEFYIANWDVGDALVPEDAGGMLNDEATGQYALQIACKFNHATGEIQIDSYGGFTATLEQTDDTKAVYKLWPNEDGYIIEGQVYLPDVYSDETGNLFEFTGGTRIPATWSLYDIDESESSADFQGFAYTPSGYAGWQGPGPGWQVCDVIETPRGQEWDVAGTFDFVHPYIKRAVNPITVDGDLEEWNFVFPAAHDGDVIPATGRFVEENPGWWIDDPDDCSGNLYVMYDDEYFYFAAAVRDDAPGHYSDAAWAADAVEFYMANWDIGDALHAEDAGGMPNDGDTGDYALQLAIKFNDAEGVTQIDSYGGFTGTLEQTDDTKAVYSLWDDGDGYYLEGKILLADVYAEDTGNLFEFVEGTRIPFTWSLYDIDESESSGDFQGHAYTPSGYAAYAGPGPGWQYVDVKGVSFIEYMDGETAVAENPAPVVANYSLLQNYPNPFNPTTTIEYSLNGTQNVSLNVYDILGKQVASLVNGVQSAGEYRYQFDGANLTGGVYLYKLQAGDFSEIRRMVLLK